MKLSICNHYTHFNASLDVLSDQTQIFSHYPTDCRDQSNFCSMWFCESFLSTIKKSRIKMSLANSTFSVGLPNLIEDQKFSKRKASFPGNSYLFLFYFCEGTEQTSPKAPTCTGLVKVGFLPCPIKSIGVLLGPLVRHGSADALISEIVSFQSSHSSLYNLGLGCCPQPSRPVVASQPQP